MGEMETRPREGGESALSHPPPPPGYQSEPSVKPQRLFADCHSRQEVFHFLRDAFVLETHVRGQSHFLYRQ